MFDFLALEGFDERIVLHERIRRARALRISGSLRKQAVPQSQGRMDGLFTVATDRASFSLRGAVWPVVPISPSGKSHAIPVLAVAERSCDGQFAIGELSEALVRRHTTCEKK